MLICGPVYVLMVSREGVSLLYTTLLGSCSAHGKLVSAVVHGVGLICEGHSVEAGFA